MCAIMQIKRSIHLTHEKNNNSFEDIIIFPQITGRVSFTTKDVLGILEANVLVTLLVKWI